MTVVVIMSPIEFAGHRDKTTDNSVELVRIDCARTAAPSRIAFDLRA